MLYQYFIFFSWYLGDQQIQIEHALINGLIAFISSLVFIIYIHIIYFPNKIVNSPKIMTFPPLIMLGSFSLGFLIGVINLYYFQLYQLPNILDVLRSSNLGFILIIFSFLLISVSVYSFRKNNEDPNPTTQTSILITSGIFKYIRNPMYLALVIFQLGLGSALSFIHISLFSILTYFLLNYLVIANEERYLTELFGNEYVEYKQNSRRWL